MKEPEGRRQELIAIAMQQFMASGYEKTSVRSIVRAADGEVGMFYHHFASKEAIFEAVLDEFNRRYIEKMHDIIQKEGESGFMELTERPLGLHAEFSARGA